MRHHHSEETKRKISIAEKGNKKALGHKCSEEARRRISIANRGNKFALGCKRSAETKRKISIAKLQGNVTTAAGRKRARKLFPAPKGFDIHHIDGNPLNNSLNNIQILSHSEHTILHQKRIDSVTIGKICELHNQGLGYRKITKIIGIGRSTVRKYVLKMSGKNENCYEET